MKNIQTKYKLNFKTMKKGLLTLLAASLVFVGCQNYDDQFDDLNAQISALKSQVDGLASLSGQVSSLAGTISGLQNGIAAAQASASSAASAATAAGASADAATAAAEAATTAATAAGTTSTANATNLDSLSASLTTLAADVAAVQASLATASTAAEVAALQADIDALELDLDELLAGSNVYATDITINSASSLTAALALGNKVNLMNASITINDNTAVSDTDLQTFINRVKTITGNFVFDSGSGTGAAPTFDEMVSAASLNIDIAGPISFKKLASATTITVGTSYTTKVTSVDFSALTSLTSFASNAITATSATNVDLGALTRYGSTLSISTKEGATLDIGKLDDVSATGVLDPITLALTGPASFTSTLLTDGTITLTDVATASIENFYGIIDIKGGVETLTVTDGVFVDLDEAANLKTATLDFAIDYDPDLTVPNKAIAAAGYSTSYLENYGTTTSIAAPQLTSLTVTGQLLDLYLDEANLETLSIDATMTALTLKDMTDLTTLTVSADSKIGSVSATGNTNIAVMDFNHTTNLEQVGSATALKSVSATFTGNSSLTTLNWSGDDVSSLNVSDNDKLTAIDFTGLKD
jgi:uncharacterized lipoprotein NlpE involved in copper resistance